MLEIYHVNHLAAREDLLELRDNHEVKASNISDAFQEGFALAEKAFIKQFASLKLQVEKFNDYREYRRIGVEDNSIIHAANGHAYELRWSDNTPFFFKTDDTSGFYKGLGIRDLEYPIHVYSIDTDSPSQDDTFA